MGKYLGFLSEYPLEIAFQAILKHHRVVATN